MFGFKCELDNGFIDMCGRARIMKPYAKYLNAMGKDAYVIPSYFLYRDKAPCAICSLINRIKKLFDAADQLESWHCGDYLSLWLHQLFLDCCILQDYVRRKLAA